MSNNLNLNLLTSYAAVVQIETEYYIPISTAAGYPIGSIYAFIGQEDSWPIVNGQETPTQPTNDQKYFKRVFKNMIAAKLMSTNNLSPVIQRIDWKANTVYAAYSDTVDMSAKDNNGLLLNEFYVKNRYDQVFKCLSNNNGTPSTYEPYFQPGSYGTNNIYENADYYKWKYMYTVDAGRKRTFMDSLWMPVPVGANTPQPYLTSAGCGDIEVINVTNGGSGYDPVNTYIVVTVTGDGSGAIANVSPSQIVGGVIKDVVVKTPGTNYTYANVAFTAYTSANQKFISASGTGATAVSPISPVGGHSYDWVSELGCSNIMFAVEFNGTEGGTIPTTGVTYRQVGLLIDPQIYGINGAQLANGAIYNTTTQIQLSSGLGNVYQPDEVVVQYDNNSNILYSGTVVSFNTSTNLLQIINTSGTFVIGQQLFGTTSGAQRTVFNVTLPSLIPFSGYITYIENRIGVTRSDDGIEQFKFVLGY
jgi:hypothetical protein